MQNFDGTSAINLQNINLRNSNQISPHPITLKTINTLIESSHELCEENWKTIKNLKKIRLISEWKRIN